MTRLTIALLFCSLAAISAPAAQNQGTDNQPIPAVEQTAPPAAHSAAQPDDVIGPDDSVAIVVLEADEISKTWRVTSAGDLDLPIVGKIHAAGSTAEQLQERLSEQLKRYIRTPHVTVYIAEFRSQPVTVSGAVHRPGTFQTEGPKTLWTVLTMAGGLDKPGSTVTITREIRYGLIPLPGAHLNAAGDHSVIDLPMKEVSNIGGAASNLLIRPNDVISVSDEQRMVYIIGEVVKPGEVELVTQDSVSTMQVLAAAGGLSKMANAHHTEIMRQNAQGLYEKVGEIDLKKLVNGKTEDRLLMPGDIVVVPSSTLKLYSGMAAMSAISTGMYAVLARY